MAAARQDQTGIKDILVEIDKDGRGCVEWDVENTGPMRRQIDGGQSLNATVILQQVLANDPDTMQAALSMPPDALLKFSFSSARPGDYRVLSGDRLGYAPGCFFSMDNALDFETRTKGISKITFFLEGQVVIAIASGADLQNTDQPVPAKSRAPGRL